MNWTQIAQGKSKSRTHTQIHTEGWKNGGENIKLLVHLHH